MNCRSLLVALAVLSCSWGCHRKAAGHGASRSSATAGVLSSNAPTSAAAGVAAPASQACISSFDYLLPPQKYEDGDMFRAMLVDGDQVYVRDRRDVYRLPITGGSPFLLSRGPLLASDGTTALWLAGSQLLTQLSNDPIFMASAKTGGTWRTIVDLSESRVAHGGDAGVPNLRIVGHPSSSPIVGRAIFDGSTFFWPERQSPATRFTPAISSIASAPLAGGKSFTLLQSRGELSQLAKIGGQLVFIHTEPPSVAQLNADRSSSRTGQNQVAVQGPKSLMSISVTGGRADRLAHFGNPLGGEVLLVDGQYVYLSGYADEDSTKPGIYKIKSAAGSPLEQVDNRTVQGTGFGYKTRILFVGSGSLDGGDSQQANVVLMGSRTGGAVSRIACITGPYTTPAFAIAGNVLLISLFKIDTLMASIIRVPLPRD